jgi:hypothetical protein
MNYGEELAYWYLRLNGFFPIADFVIHKSGGMKRSSDCDVLAVRPPYVYEEVGGKPDDWDQALLSQLDCNRTIGAICEVKTGGYTLDKLFRKHNLKSPLGRLGFTPWVEVNRITDTLFDAQIVNIGDSYQIFKLLIANEEPREQQRFIFVSLAHAREFLMRRMKKYLPEKNRDRMFFNSNLLQDLIEQNRRLDAEE